jgi:ribosomal-protein-alanine N-acetyltransferase
LKISFIQKLFKKIPELEGERVLLRRLRVSDASEMYDYARRESVTRYLLWSPHPDPEHTRQYLSYVQGRYRVGEFYDWAIVDKASGKMIGTCGFPMISEANNSAEVGYVLHPDFWGKGYATEVLRILLSFAFKTLGLHRVEARCFEEHAASRRVMEKCGMRYEGSLRDALLVKGRYESVAVYSILNDSQASH